MNSIEELVNAYRKGQRTFDGWDFEPETSAQGLALNQIQFVNCILFLDFRNANLRGAKFIQCNLKTADFRGANLDDALIRNCSVESVMFKGASVRNFRFEENYCFGATTSEGDFEAVFKDADEA